MGRPTRAHARPLVTETALCRAAERPATVMVRGKHRASRDAGKTGTYVRRIGANRAAERRRP